jgi:predicted ribosome quality control (RQC) complex YloA/Tae2 family protein
MKKSELIAKLEGAKELTPVVSIDLVLAALGMLEPEIKVEKVFGMSQELAEEIASRIERCLDNNASDLVDTDSAEFSLNYSNCIELDCAQINVYDTMEHINTCLEEFIVNEEEDEDVEEAIEEQIEEEGTLRDE